MRILEIALMIKIKFLSTAKIIQLEQVITQIAYLLAPHMLHSHHVNLVYRAVNNGMC